MTETIVLKLGTKHPQCGVESWARHTRKKISAFANHKLPVANVPCGDCHACCIGYEIELRPEDDATLKSEAAKDGARILARKEDRSCAYLIDGNCSIYDKRPASCREYDCRVNAFCQVFLLGKDHINKASFSWNTQAAIKTKMDWVVHFSLATAYRHLLPKCSDADVAAGSAVMSWEAFVPLEYQRLVNRSDVTRAQNYLKARFMADAT